MVEFSKYITALSTNGFPRYWYSSSDDSKHNKTDRHALAFSSPDVNGDPSYKTLSTMPATGKDADSNAEMNFNLFKDKIDPLALVHYGGGVTDNASAAAKERNLTFNKVMKIAKEPISLENPVGDEDGSYLGDFIEDKNAVLPSEAAFQSNLRETTTRILSILTPREERVLRMRFGIGVNTDHTLEEVGQQFNVTRERIRQIEAKALRKLKHPTRSKKMISFLNGSSSRHNSN
jgi:RNA polymerase sigma factor (sigma-70 family)